ncbi:hypothetical protein Tco_0088831 [Tanacetum coccineum]
MDAPTLLVSAKKNLGDPIEIRVDIVHPAPVDVFTVATVMSVLKFRMGMAEEENASPRGKINNHGRQLGRYNYSHTGEKGSYGVGATVDFSSGGPATRPRELQEALGVCDQKVPCHAGK